MRALSCILFIMLTAYLPLKGQETNYEQKQYGQLDGLLTQTVHCIHQDSLGYLVLGTDNGVFLFDGHNFSRPQYQTGIESKRIEGIQPIAANEYLLLGGSPNTVYYVKNNRIVWNQILKGARNIGQLFYYEPVGKKIYFKDGTRLYTKSFEQLSKPEVCIDWPETILSFTVDPTGGIYLWDNTEQLSYLVDGAIQVSHRALIKDLIWKFYNRQDGTTLAWTQDSILVLKEGAIASTIPHETPTNLVVRNAGTYTDGTLWFTDDGPNLFECRQNNSTNTYQRFSLQGFSITSALKDANNTYWLGTEGTGLLRLQKANNKMISGSAGIKITNLAQGNGHLLVGTDEGIFIKELGKLRRLKPTKEYAGDLQDVFNKNYTHRLDYTDNHWLISTMQTNPTRPRGLATQTVLGQAAVALNGPSMQLVSNQLLNGLWGGFNIRSLRDEDFGQKTSFKGSFGRTNEFIVTKEGFVAVCDRRIIMAQKNASGSYDTLSVLKANSLTENLTYNDLEICGDQWYIATSKGLFKGSFNPLTHRLTQVTQLTFGESHCILSLGDALWIGSTSGLLKYSNDLIIPFLIATDQGDPNVTCLLFDKENSRLLVGTLNGLFEIDPFAQPLKDKLLRLGPYSLVMNGVPIESNFKEIDLKYDQNTFEIQASLLNFLNPIKAELMYTVNEAEPEKGSYGNIRFNSLEANDYAIRVWAETSNGQKTEAQLLRVHISQPFWKQGWFLVSGLLFITSVSLLIIYLRSKQIKKRVQLEQETQQLLNALEKKALNLSLNPHFLFNSLNSIQSRVSTFKDEGLVNYIADFSSLMRKTLENSDRSIIGLDEEMEQLLLYLKMEQRRYADKFSYAINIPEAVHERELELPPMLLQPFVENSIIHGILPATYKGFISIDVAVVDCFLQLTIIDNGLGLQDHPQHHQSKGLDITRKRILLLHPSNSISINDRDDDTGESGVIVKIRLLIEE